MKSLPTSKRLYLRYNPNNLPTLSRCPSGWRFFFGFSERLLAVPTSQFGSTTQSNQKRRQPCHIALSSKHWKHTSATTRSSCLTSPTSRLPTCSSQRISYRRKIYAFKTTSLDCHQRPSSIVVSNVRPTSNNSQRHSECILWRCYRLCRWHNWICFHRCRSQQLYELQPDRKHFQPRNQPMGSTSR